ncbi:MAG: OmpA family protein [Bacteroidales bacterium]|nr:OmpA family protein [Bacteroidales bacterium]
MKRLFVIMIAALALVFSAQAQVKSEFNPGWNLTVQGGVNYTSSNRWAIDHWHHFTSNGQVALGYKFSPVFGLRGVWTGPIAAFPTNEGKDMGTMHYLQLGADAVFDLLNIFNYNPTRFISPYAFLGAAGNYRFETTDAKGFFGPAVRAGLGFAFRLDDVAKLVIELNDNALSNKFNTLDDNEIFAADVLNWKRPFKWDDNFSALVGLQFDLSSGRTSRPIVDPGYSAPIVEAEAEAARLAAERAAAERAAAERAAAERAAAERAAAERAAAEAAARAAQQRPAAPASITESVYFDLNKSVLKADQQSKIDNLISYLRQNPTANVTITGYADKATGTASRNMTLSEQRANVVKKALTDAGISASRITTEYYGDTQQVSAVPEMNRVAVCVTK